MLTPRQLQVARLIADGYTNEEIASMLGISPRTVKGYSDLIVQRIGAPNRRRIAERLRELGLLGPGRV